MIKTILDIFLTFLKIGMFSFGGGYAILAFMEREIITNHSWLTTSEFMDVVGISQMTPGPIAINAATYVGYKISGVLGSIAGTLGVIIFSFLLVSIANHYMNKFKESQLMKSVLKGMRPALIGLILSAFISFSTQAYKDIKSVIIGGIVLALLLSKKLHPILVIVLSGIMGIIFYGIFT